MTRAYRLSRAIVICGKTASGKSTAVRSASGWLGFKVVSFGALVRARATELGLPDSRESLQDLGYRLFQSLGADGLLQAALEYAGIEEGDSAVIDGVRHPSVPSQIQAAADTVLSFYFDVDDEERYRRYLSKGPLSPQLAFKEFLAIHRHPIEQGIEPLASLVDVIVDTTLTRQEVWEQIAQNLAARGISKI